MSMKQNSPIFVIGTPRSGTTLTAKILGRHSNIFMPGETHYYLDIYAQKKSIGNLSTDVAQGEVIQRLLSIYGRYNEPEDQERVDQLFSDKNNLKEITQSANDYNELFEKFMRIQANAAGKMRWGNNAPKDIFYIKEIISMFPDARIVLCVRDIRDFLGSYRDKWKVTAEFDVSRLKQLYHPVVTSMLWKTSMKQIKTVQDVVPANNLFVLPYEKLVADPKKTVESICEFLEEDYDSAMLDINYHNSSESRKTGGIFSTAVGSWKGRISNEEAWIAQKLAKRDMEQLGYQLEPIPVNPIKVFWLFLTSPVALYRGLQANKQNTGPIIPYLIRRISALLAH